MRLIILAGVLAIGVVGSFWFHSQRVAPGPPDANPQPAAEEGLLFAFDGAIDSTGLPAPWQLKCSTGKAQLAVQSHDEIPEVQVLWVKADKASFFLARTDREFAAGDFPMVEWSWKAVTLPTGGDVRKSSLNPFAENKNDQALQLVVTFDNGDAISYLWDTTAPLGTEVKEANPFVNLMSVVVESGTDQLGTWRSYRRDVAEDYRRLHGGKATVIKAVAVQTNANHTRSVSEGHFGQIRFSTRVDSSNAQ